MGESPRCRVCGKSEAAHTDMKHKFTTTGKLEVDESSNDVKKRVPVAQTAPSAALRSDPLLRLLLIRKGVVNEAELTALEEELRTTGIVYAEDQPGTPRRDNGDGVDDRGRGLRHSGKHSFQSDPEESFEHLQFPI